MNKLQQKLQQKLKNISMYELALDMGISQYSLYCYLNDYAAVSESRKQKIQKYIEEKVDKIV